MQAADWPTNTVVIGGVDGLTKDQFVELVQKPNTTYDTVENRLDRVQAHQWVNCVVTWAKLPTGEVRSWVQPKLSPAWVELNVDYMSMYRGRSIYVFRGTHSNVNVPYQFATLLCFDWIGSSDTKRMWEWLLEGIATHAEQTGGILPLTWLFVAQCNPAPSHASFMNQVGRFFDPAQFPRVARDEMCLVMANVAGKGAPGRTDKYGQSSIIFTNRFARPDCMPTYGNGGAPQRGGGILENFRDAVFRESGACIHSFLVTHPGTLPPGAAGRQLALREATVHPFNGVDDPRAPGGAVPAVIKWMNDELDEPSKSLALKYAHLPLTAAASAAHQRAVRELRTLKPDALNNTVNFASLTACKGTPDEWSTGEGLSVKHLLQTFSIFDVAQYPASFHGIGAHATIMKGEASLEVIAVMGASHEDCDRHVLDRLPAHRGQLVVVSRDEDNTSWDSRFKSIYDQVPDEPSTEAKFTQPTSAIIRVGYHDVLDAYRNAANEVELKEALDAKLS
ncbi:hypothetical protein [Cupriavidus basilensis]|uniref:hypothetical protein n=1 Tax=Cupriavidus basilensis TaxID=68895 RepID=UPI00157B8DCC|nr:hypothetical protein [Cupriavidus basilensis]NUA30542.1 hypothetical protein [Cupriavidus basilensis]